MTKQPIHATTSKADVPTVTLNRSVLVNLDTPLRTAILNLVCEKKSVSMIEIMRLPGTEGEFTFEAFNNCIIWDSISQEGLEAISSLMWGNLIEPHGASVLIYLIDGGHLKLPLAKKERAYKHPHWLPIVFEPVKSDHT